MCCLYYLCEITQLDRRCSWQKVLLCYECSLVGWQHLSSPFRLSSYHKKDIYSNLSRGRILDGTSPLRYLFALFSMVVQRVNEENTESKVKVKESYKYTISSQ